MYIFRISTGPGLFYLHNGLHNFLHTFAFSFLTPPSGILTPPYIILPPFREVFLVLITAGTGVIEGVLEMASESLGGFMRS